MQRYDLHSAVHRDDGAFVTYADAEAEKVAYGRASFDNGYSTGYAAAVVAREQKPGKIARLGNEATRHEMKRTLNELIDAYNKEVSV